MPTVPEPVHDPFGTKDKGKDQGRPPSLPQVDALYLMMAAATMHDMGRLVEPSPRNGMDYSILEEKTDKEFTDAVKWVDDMVEKERPDLRKGWEKRRKDEIRNEMKNKNDYPNPELPPPERAVI